MLLFVNTWQPTLVAGDILTTTLLTQCQDIINMKPAVIIKPLSLSHTSLVLFILCPGCYYYYFTQHPDRLHSSVNKCQHPAVTIIHQGHSCQKDPKDKTVLPPTGIFITTSDTRNILAYYKRIL